MKSKAVNIGFQSNLPCLDLLSLSKCLQNALGCYIYALEKLLHLILNDIIRGENI